MAFQADLHKLAITLTLFCDTVLALREKAVPIRRRISGGFSPGVAGYSGGSFPVNS